MTQYCAVEESFQLAFWQHIFAGRLESLLCCCAVLFSFAESQLIRTRQEVKIRKDAYIKTGKDA